MNERECSNCVYFLDFPSDFYEEKREGICLASLNLKERTIESVYSYENGYNCEFYNYMPPRKDTDYGS